ncbi:MAG: hypothetical protein Q7S61_05410 [bacterium]|nr:hypothetical protein [bacterium]
MKNKSVLIGLLLLGIFIRLVAVFLLNYSYDFFNILAIIKSVADTGNMSDGFLALSRHGFQIQLYGKIYYQIAAFWLLILEKVKILEIKYIFDTKPFKDSYTYMDGLFQWGVPLYQMVAIKLSQVFYDILFVIFLIKTGSLLRLKNSKALMLFWAVTPFLILIPYAMFQSDFAMLSFLMAGTYFWLKSTSDEHNKSIVPKLLCLFFFVLGGITKQVPMLFIPFALISFSKNIKSFLVYSLCAGVFYILLGQSWGSDTQLIKQFFLNSIESTAIFNFQLNGVSLFLFAYFAILFFYFLNQEKFKGIYTIYLIAIVIFIVYITEDAALLFPQFSIWILPFLALISLHKPAYSWMLFIPFVLFMKRFITDSDLLAGVFLPTLGNRLGSVIDYKTFIQAYFSPNLIGLILTSFAGFLQILAIGSLLNEFITLPILNRLHETIGKLKWDLVKVTKLIFFLYLLLLLADFTFKSRFIPLPSPNLEESQKEIALTGKPLSIYIENPKPNTITTVDLAIRRKQITFPDTTVLRFKNPQGKILSETKVSDYAFPTVREYVTVFLKKPVSEKKLILEIYKEHGYNEIALQEALFIPGRYMGLGRFKTGYDEPLDSEYITTSYPKTKFMVGFRGVYGIDDVFNALSFHIQNKPKFFLLYIPFTLIILISSIILIKRSKIGNEESN